MKYDLAAFPKLEGWLKASLARSGAQETLKLRAANPDCEEQTGPA